MNKQKTKIHNKLPTSSSITQINKRQKIADTQLKRAGAFVTPAFNVSFTNFALL